MYGRGEQRDKEERDEEERDKREEKPPIRQT